MQLGFFIQRSASKGGPRVRFAHIRQLNRGAPLAHTPYVVLFACSDDWVFRNLFQSFFLSRHLHIRCAH